MSNGKLGLVNELYSPDKLLKDLGMKYKPSKELYQRIMKKTQAWATKGFLKNSFEIKGAENLDEESFQIFAFNHELYEDPIMVQTAITLASKNNTPISTPGHKDYIFSFGLGHLMQKLNSYVLYSEKDGYIKDKLEIKENKKKEASLKYSEYCLLEYGRVLIFPVGSLSFDGKQIQGVHKGKRKNGTFFEQPIMGRIGMADIVYRANKKISQTDFLKGKKIQIIPGYITYDPLDFVSKRKKGSKVTVRFGKSLDDVFKKQVINKSSSFMDKFEFLKDEEKKDLLTIDLQKEFMNNVMKEIGSLITITMDHVASRVLFDLAKNKKHLLEDSCVNEKYFEHKVYKLVDVLKDSNLFLSCYFNEGNSVLMKNFYNEFLNKVEKKGFFARKEENLKLNLDKIFFEPSFMKVRNKNLILYNFNKLEHLEEYKKIEEAVLRG